MSSFSQLSHFLRAALVRLQLCLGSTKKHFVPKVFSSTLEYLLMKGKSTEYQESLRFLPSLLLTSQSQVIQKLLGGLGASSCHFQQTKTLRVPAGLPLD